MEVSLPSTRLLKIGLVNIAGSAYSARIARIAQLPPITEIKCLFLVILPWKDQSVGVVISGGNRLLPDDLSFSCAT